MSSAFLYLTWLGHEALDVSGASSSGAGKGKKRIGPGGAEEEGGPIQEGLLHPLRHRVRKQLEVLHSIRVDGSHRRIAQRKSLSKSKKRSKPILNAEKQIDVAEQRLELAQKTKELIELYRLQLESDMERLCDVLDIQVNYANQPLAKAKRKHPFQEYLAPTISELPSDDASWCLCGQHDYGGPMTACDNSSCPFEWYHNQCVGIGNGETFGQKFYCHHCRHTENERSIISNGPSPSSNSKQKKHKR